jgi:hypothetical protein
MDGPWKYNIKDRLGSYITRGIFKSIQLHCEHLPIPTKQSVINYPHLFIAHVQWLDKPTVAVKQYFYKILDYVNKTVYNTNTVPPSAYDDSVANFNWEYETFSPTLKIPADIYSTRDISSSYKYKFIKDKIKEFDIPNLNDWGMGIH